VRLNQTLDAYSSNTNRTVKLPGNNQQITSRKRVSVGGGGNVFN